MIMRESKMKGKCYRYDPALGKMVEIEKVGHVTLPEGIKPPDGPASLYFDVVEEERTSNAD